MHLRPNLFVIYISVRNNIIALRLKSMFNINFDEVGVVIVEDATYYDTLYADDTSDLEFSTFDVHFFDFPKINEGNIILLNKQYQHGCDINSTLMCPNPFIFFQWQGSAMKLKQQK